MNVNKKGSIGRAIAFENFWLSFLAGDAMCQQATTQRQASCRISGGKGMWRPAEMRGEQGTVFALPSRGQRGIPNRDAFSDLFAAVGRYDLQSAQVRLAAGCTKRPPSHGTLSLKDSQGPLDTMRAALKVRRTRRA